MPMGGGGEGCEVFERGVGFIKWGKKVVFLVLIGLKTHCGLDARMQPVIRIFSFG